VPRAKGLEKHTALSTLIWFWLRLLNGGRGWSVDHSDSHPGISGNESGAAKLYSYLLPFMEALPDGHHGLGTTYQVSG
jgi:hypothetical protein